MDEDKITLLNTKELGKKVLDSWAYILLVIVMLLAVLSGYTDVRLDLAATVNIGANYAILLVSCYASMYSLDSIAKKRGAEDKRYSEASAKIDAVRERIKREDDDLVQAFCEEYRTTELACARKQILSEAMLNERDLDEFIRTGKAPDGMPFVQKLALKRARSCKPIKLNRYMIGRPLFAKKKRDSFETPEQAMARGNVFIVLTTAITVIFPVSIAMSVLMEPSLATLVEGLLKVFTIALAGAKAYNGRLKVMVETIPAYATIQEDLADRFDAWKKRNNPDESAPEALPLAPHNSPITPP